MKAVYAVSRYLLGLMFFVVGPTGFLSILPPPEMHGNLPILGWSGYLLALEALEVLGVRCCWPTDTHGTDSSSWGL